MSTYKVFVKISKVFICFTAILFSSARHRAGAGERGAATCQGLKNVPMIALHVFRFPVVWRNINFFDKVET